MNRLRLLLFAFLVTWTCASSAQDAVFKRLYKAEEKNTYTVKMAVGKSISITVDIDEVVTKLLNKGATVKFHMYNKVETGTTQPAALPADLSLDLGAHNLPEKFRIAQGSVDFLTMFLLLSGITTDGAAAVGKEAAIEWSAGDLAFSGSTKIVEIAEGKTLKAETKGKLTMQGNALGDVTIRSTYDLATGMLVESKGSAFQGLNELTIARKGKD